MTDALLETRPSFRRPQATKVIAVVVTRGHTEYLEETLAALAAQQRAPEHVLVVDAEPDGPLGDVLPPWAGTARPVVVPAPGARTFGAAVRAGLASGAVATVADGRREWVWLLHDDSAPEPGALAELLRAVEVAPSVAIAGCKQRTWSGHARVVEVGLTTSRFGRRMTGIDEPEVDQGQHDSREDVLGVGTAGALVRRDVWDDLGGPDPALGPYGDGLDLSRRARLAGHRVVVVPRAVVRHAQASLARPVSGAVINRPGWDAARSARARREAFLHAQLTGVPLGLVPVVALLAVVSGAVRALGRFLTKEPHLVLPELLAPWGVLLRPGRVARARRRAARTRRMSRRSLRPLQVTWRDVVRQAQDRRLTAAEIRRTRQAPSELELAELAALRGRRRAGLAVAALVAVAVTAVALGPLVTRVLAGERLVGGALAGGATDLGGLWAATLADHVPTGLGQAGPTDPLLTALVPFTALLGSVGAASAALVLGGLVLSALGAWFAAGAATRSVALRLWATLVWAASPALLVALGDGRLGGVLAHVLLPWVALGVARGLGTARTDGVLSGLVGAQREDAADDAPAPSRRPLQSPVLRSEPSLTAAAAAGLALAVVTAASPVLLPAGLLVLLAVATVVRRRRGRLVLVALPALALHAPLVAEAVRTWGDGGWRLLLTDPAPAVATDPAPAWQQLLGRPVVETWPFLPPWGVVLPLVASGVVLLVALVALVRRAGARGVRTGWFVAAVGLGSAVLVGQVVTAAADAPTGGVVLTTAWPGGALSLTLAGLLVAALLGADGVRGAMAHRAFGWRQVVVGVVAILVVAGPAAGLGAWVADVRPSSGQATAGELSTTAVPVVPAVGRQIQTSPDAARVLRLEAAQDGLTATLLRRDGVQLVETARTVTARGLTVDGRPAPRDAADQALAEATARLATGAGQDTAVRLAELGVGAVLVPASAEQDGARTALVGRLDATLGLERMTETEAGVIWRVAAPSVGTTSAWARLQESEEVAPVASRDGRVDTTVPAGARGRLLVLADRADSSWRAWLDGVPLRAVDVDWRQAFEVGPDAGRLVVEQVAADRAPWLWLQGAVLLVTVLLAVPVRRRRGGLR